MFTVSEPVKGDYFIKTIEKETKSISIQSSYSVTEIPEKLSKSPVSSPVKSASPIRSQCIPTPVSSPSINMHPAVYTSYAPAPDTFNSKSIVNSQGMNSQGIKKPCERATAIRWTGYPPEAVSIVRPTTFVPDKSAFIQRVAVYPEQLKSKSVSMSPDYVPEQRDKPAGLDVDDFLPVSLFNYTLYLIVTFNRYSIK